MSELAGYSDAFILSQVDYYAKHQRCGPSRDWNQLHGLLQHYRAEAKRRGLVKA